MSRIFLLLVVALACDASPAFAGRIANDPGGLITTYVQRFNAARDSGERIVIDGPCLSACTLVLGLVPRERICVTSNASLGFHAAWNEQGGQEVANPTATASLWQMYPQPVRQWIGRHGGLGRNMIYLRGRELAAMYPSCPREFGPHESVAAAGWAWPGQTPTFAKARHRPLVRRAR